MFGAQSIQTGNAHIVITGGMESMSQVPYYVTKHRVGVKMGHQELLDGMIIDGLWDPTHQYLMGNAAERCAEKYCISRQEQDDYAVLSYKKAIEATREGILTEHTVNMKDKSDTSLEDESLKKFDEGKLRSLKPIFQSNGGTVTAGNSSSISDGACSLILVSGEKVRQYGIKPLARILSFSDAQQNPEDFTTSPSLAISKALKLAELSISDIDFFEINEAFSVVTLANQKLLNIPIEKINIYGGAVAIGHPLGW
jgi:acetyl-CoA C-acetyltransferase